jgi:T5SS/PEP-CTERM-associated repeat protein/autotransporter-associated beta strand protein
VLWTTWFLSIAAAAPAAIVVSGDVGPGTRPSGDFSYIGNTTAGSISIDGGSVMYTGTLCMGRTSAATGTALISGTGSKWTITTLYVGEAGQGTVTIAAGAQLTSYTTYMGFQSGSAGLVNLTGPGSTWANSESLYVGSSSSLGYVGGSMAPQPFGSASLVVAEGGALTTKRLYASLNDVSGNGTITVSNGGALDADLVLGAGPQTSVAFGSGGTLTFGFGSSDPLGVGYKESGSLSITSGRAVTSGDGYLGYGPGSTGMATVSGAGSTWTNAVATYVGYIGHGELVVEAGGKVLNRSGFVGYNGGSSGTATVRGVGSKWSLTSGTGLSVMTIGEWGNGTLIVEDGGEVSSSSSYVGVRSGGTGSVIVRGAGAKWQFGQLLVGHLGNGAVNVENGGTIVGGSVSLANTQNSTSALTVSGTGSKFTSSDEFWLGSMGYGTLRIADGGQVISNSCHIGYYTVAQGAATVTGANSKWTCSGLVVGYGASGYIGPGARGELTIDSGGVVNSTGGRLGYNTKSSGRATVSGANSKWINGGLDVGYSGSGELSVAAGAQVNSASSYLGYNSGSSGTATVGGAESKWTHSGALYVGHSGSGALTIVDGAEVSCTTCYVGYNTGSSGTITVSGEGSRLLCSTEFRFGSAVGGILNVGAGSGGGLVKAKALSARTVKLDGGTLQAQTINSAVSFNWSDGTIKNYDANTNLSVAGTIALGSTGTHAFQIDANRSGTINAIMADASTGGTLAKTGPGTLILAAANSYSGDTTVEEGVLKVTGSLLNTSSISVHELATLEMARSTGGATAAAVPIENDGMLLISTIGQQVGTITGAGVTQINVSGNLTADCIIQNSLIIGPWGRLTLRQSASTMPTGDMVPVPEPSTLPLLLAAVVGIVLVRCRR